VSRCEKCWSDAHWPDSNSSEEYNRLIDERRDSPCTPEQMAGPQAKECPVCHRYALHQWTGEPMCGCETGWVPDTNGRAPVPRGRGARLALREVAKAAAIQCTRKSESTAFALHDAVSCYRAQFPEPAPPSLAERIAEGLFHSGLGQDAERLVLVSKSGRDLGGWGRGPLIDRIDGLIEADRAGREAT